MLAGLVPAAPVTAAPVPTAKYVLAEFGYDQGWRTERHIRTLADVTRDGKADIVAFGDDGVWTSIALGGGKFAPPKFVLAGYGHNSGWRIGKHPRWVADITGDGFADLVGAGPDGVWTAEGLKAGSTRGRGPELRARGPGGERQPVRGQRGRVRHGGRVVDRGEATHAVFVTDSRFR